MSLLVKYLMGVVADAFLMAPGFGSVRGRAQADPSAASGGGATATGGGA